MIVNNHAKGESMLPEWLAVVKQTVENTTTKKLMLFCAFTNDLVKENTLNYFKGDELAANVFVTKYALKNKKGEYLIDEDYLVIARNPEINCNSSAYLYFK